MFCHHFLQNTRETTRRMKHPLKKQANERQVWTPGLQSGCFKVHKFLIACLEIRKDAVFVPKPVWRGATRENTPRGSATEEQQRKTGLGTKTPRAKALFPLNFVVAVVTARHGDAPTAPLRPRPKSTVATPFRILRQAPWKNLTSPFGLWF